jgi:hypothetical protein
MHRLKNGIRLECTWAEERVILSERARSVTARNKRRAQNTYDAQLSALKTLVLDALITGNDRSVVSARARLNAFIAIGPQNATT